MTDFIQYIHPWNQGKKSSLVSGNKSGEFFLSLAHPHSQDCIRIYIFCFEKEKKNTDTYTNKKEKKLKKRAGCKFWNLQWYVHVSDWILNP